MKKLILTVLSLALLSPHFASCRHGGAAVAGAFGGLALGTMLGTAAANSNNSSRAEREAIRAQDRADQLQREQQQDRLDQLRRELDQQNKDRQMQEQKLIQEQLMQKQQTQPVSDTMVMMLMFVALLLFFAVVGLSILVLRKRK
ncbi:MAG: hypothetical protein H6679_00185 [Epsilonproteobacteria bacterium]|nr:hypothetical protein [Campylobacterota bacterium]